MQYIEFLGTSGTKTSSAGTTCLRVANNCVIDAGNLIEGTGEGLFLIEHIFLSHSHLDHIVDIAFMADLFVTRKKSPLKIYGLKETLNNLRHFIFNHQIWPNFEEINLIDRDAKTIEFIEIFPDERYRIDEIILTPFKTNHMPGSCGYLIEHNENGILFTSDTYRCQKIWEVMEANPHVHSLIVDVSFPSVYDKLAYDSRHMTPKILAEELVLCKRQDFRVFPMHLKSLFEATIRDELNAFGILKQGGHVLESYECLSYDPEIVIETCSRDDYHSVISKITSIGTALSSEKDIDALLEIILLRTRQLTDADSGTLYLYNVKSSQLEFKVVQNDSMKIEMGGTHGVIEWKPLELYDLQNNENHQMVAAVCALKKIVVNIPNVYESTLYDFTGTIDFDTQTGYRSRSMLVLPLKDHEENLIGVLQLINKKDRYDGIIPFNYQDEEIALSLTSQAAVALTKQKLINDLELLLESFLHTINVAIEEKSPYTAGHIDKMVDLSLVLASEISEDQDYFPNISYSNDQLKEIKFAALMHDIGKITSPEHVIDKSTKLETIFDRIEAVSLKYEILKRDAYTDYLIEKNNLIDSKSLKKLEDKYHKLVEELDEEIIFLKTANIGSEFFGDENVQRVQTIAQRSVRLNGVLQPLLNEDEVTNLSVQKGTLTYKQRMIINNHAHVSLRMLKQLPFPRKLERVAEIACGHHEKINGGGYPLGLKGDELSFEARILAIADIFEALSASDRPYKKAKKLSEVMKILFFMAKDEEIDYDIMRFFYESGLYLRYAKKALNDENIDEVVLDFNYKEKI